MKNVVVVCTNLIFTTGFAWKQSSCCVSCLQSSCCVSCADAGSIGINLMMQGSPLSQRSMCVCPMHICYFTCSNEACILYQLDCILCLIQYLYDPGTLPSSANKCSVGKCIRGPVYIGYYISSSFSVHRNANVSLLLLFCLYIMSNGINSVLWSSTMQLSSHKVPIETPFYCARRFARDTL